MRVGSTGAERTAWLFCSLLLIPWGLRNMAFSWTINKRIEEEILIQDVAEIVEVFCVGSIEAFDSMRNSLDRLPAFLLEASRGSWYVFLHQMVLSN